MEQQQQQQQRIHQSVLEGIERRSDPNRREEERHILSVHGYNKPPVDRQSWEHLVDFLDDRGSHEVTELVLYSVRLSDPSDGGLDVLRDFFGRSDTTLTKVTLSGCDFGDTEDTVGVIAAFHTNRTVSDFTIRYTINLEGATLGVCLANLMQNMPQLQRLDCSLCALHVDGVRTFQPALQTNRTLRELNLSYCDIRDEGIRILADGFFGNTTMDLLNIADNDITVNGLADITQLLESTRLKTIYLHANDVFLDGNATHRFARALSRHEFLKDLRINDCGLGGSAIRRLVDGLVGNTILEVLDIDWNAITPVGLTHITRLLESTQLKTICFGTNRGVLNDQDATQHFVATLQHKNSSVQELPGINPHNFPNNVTAAYYTSIKSSLTRNRQLNRVNLLLVPPPASPMQQQQRNAGTMMLKTWHKAIAKFAMVPNNAGASAIIKLFTARPQLLEKRLKRPASAATATGTSHDAGNDSNPRGGGGGGGTDIKSLGGQKRRRL